MTNKFQRMNLFAYKNPESGQGCLKASYCIYIFSKKVNKCRSKLPLLTFVAQTNSHPQSIIKKSIQQQNPFFFLFFQVLIDIKINFNIIKNKQFINFD